MSVFDLNEPLINAVQPVPGWRHRLITVYGSAGPTNIGPMIGGSTSTTFVAPSNTEVSFDISSNNANDIGKGSGCESVLIYGLDGSFNPINEIVDLNGTSAVSLTKSYTHINELRPHSGVPAGNIVVRRTSDAQPYALISSEENASGFFRCPANFKAIMTGFTFTSGTVSTIYLAVWKNGSSTYEIITRYEGSSQLYLPDINSCVLEAGDSCYLFQITNAEAKAIMTFMLMPS